ncbi:MAG: hypothetical protein ACR2PT_12395 [Endozoicomonas sp.]
MTSSVSPHKDTGRILDFIERVLFVATLLVAASFLYQVLKYCHFGMDFTDEGFYLNWISNPWLYSASTSQFGFVYHFLYRLVGEDTVLLRQANVLLTVGLAWCLSITLLKQLLINDKGRLPWNTLNLYGIALLLSVCSLLFLRTWLISPSYNSLAFQALLIATTGFMLSRADYSRQSLAGWFLIGLGGWLAFMAKPTTAAALALTMFIGLLISRKIRPGLLGIATVTAIALTGFSAWLIDHSPAGFAERIQAGMRHSALLGGGHNLSDIFRWDTFVLSPVEQWIFAGTSCLIVAGICLGHRQLIQSRLAWCFLILASLTFGAIIQMHFYSLTDINFFFLGLQSATVLFGCVVAAILIFKQQIMHRLNSDVLVLVLFLTVLPHIYAFGTGNNYWQHGSHAGFFWVMAGVCLFGILQGSEYQWRSLLSVATSALVITIALVSTGLEFPYRQPQAVYLHKEALSMRNNKSQLVVAGDTARYLNELLKLGKGNGFNSGTPMIDLTGSSPGALFALEAKAIAQPWMIGGYSGSELLSSEALKRVPCNEIASSWILTEVQGPRILNKRILKQHGIVLHRDYQLAGSLISPKARYSATFRQQLWKPMRLPEQATAACNLSRADKT